MIDFSFCKKIMDTIVRAVADEMDETEYLLSDPVHKKTFTIY